MKVFENITCHCLFLFAKNGWPFPREIGQKRLQVRKIHLNINVVITAYQKSKVGRKH